MEDIEQENLPVELKGPVHHDKAKEVKIKTSLRCPLVVKQTDNIKNILAYVWKKGDTVYPRCEQTNGHEHQLRERINELAEGKFAYVGRSLYVSANVSGRHSYLEDVASDVFLTELNKPAVVFSVLKKDSITVEAKNHISGLVKEIVELVRQFTSEPFSAAFGLLLPSDLESESTFQKALTKITRETAKLCIPESLTMPTSKQAKVVKAFISGVALTKSVMNGYEGTATALWFLTLDQFRILTENIDKTKVTVTLYPSSGGKTLTLEVLRRLEQSGPTILISDDKELLYRARKEKIASEIQTPEDLQKSRECLSKIVHIVTHCGPDSVPDFIPNLPGLRNMWKFTKFTVVPDRGSQISAEEETKDINSCPAITTEASVEGCLSDEILAYRIKNISNVFVKVHTMEKAGELLEKYGHVTISGAPGDGKTSIALMMCQAYRSQQFEVMFVENLKNFDINLVTDKRGKYLIVFDDIFGSVAGPSNVEILHKVLSALIDSLINMTQGNYVKVKKKLKKQREEDLELSQAQPRLRVIFTSRTNLLIESSSQFFKYKASLFREEAIIDLKEQLTCEEKTNIARALKEKSKCSRDITDQDFETIKNTDGGALGFPLLCMLYFTMNRHTLDFLQDPLQHMRSNLETIIQEGTNRSAAIILLILCEGRLDLTLLQDTTLSGNNTEDMFLAVKNCIPSCTPTVIEKEIKNLIGIYCVLEQQRASFFHPSIFDASACALSTQNIELLLKNCSLRVLFERVRAVERNNKEDHKSKSDDDVTHIIHINATLYPLVVSRLVYFIRQGYFNLTVNHPILSNNSIASLLLAELKDYLSDVVQQKDKETGECFLYWTSQSDSHLIFEEGLEMVIMLDRNSVSDLKEALIACVQIGNLPFLQKVEVALSKGTRFSVNFRTNKDKTLLMLASERGQHNVVEYLINQGADGLLMDCEGKTCLHHSSESGRGEISELILDRFPSAVNLFDAYGLSPAMICVKKGHCKLLRFLVSRGADLHHSDTMLGTFLHLACSFGQTEVVRYLLSLPGDPFNINSSYEHKGMTPVAIAAIHGYFDIYKLFVLEGAALTVLNIYDQDCLLLACCGGNVDIVKHLLSLEMFDVNNRNEYTQTTPVMMAIERGHSDVYDLLSTSNIDLTLSDSFDHDCLVLACLGGNLSIVKHLLSLNIFDINKRIDLSQKTPVMVAAETGNYEIYDHLVSNGAVLSFTDKCNRNCLFLACHGGNVKIVKHLLSMKLFDINKGSGKFNQTPVMVAAERGHFFVFDLLVSQGADLLLTASNNTDCLIFSCYGGNLSVVEHLLSQNKFNINERSGPSNISPVMVAAQKGHFDVFNLLVKEGADLSLSDNNNWNCFMMACYGGNASIVKSLLSLTGMKHGYEYQRLLLAAAIGGHYDIFEMLVLQSADELFTDYVTSKCLTLACHGGNLGIVRHLLQVKGVSVNSNLSNPQTELMIALGHTIHGYVDEDIFITGTYGTNHLMASHKPFIILENLARFHTPIGSAAKTGNYHVHKFLVSKGADLSRADAFGSDCLMFACEGGNVSIVKHLLSLKHFNIDRKSLVTKKTPVMEAAQRGCYAVYMHLVSEGADLLLTDGIKRDVLIHACLGGNASILRHLLSLKIFNINSESYNKTPLMCAVQKRSSSCCKLLVSEGADVLRTDTQGRDCLMLVCERGEVFMVKYLLSLGKFDINRRCGQFNKTPLMVAAEKKHGDVFNLLLSEGADPRLSDDIDNDCFLWACYGGDVSIVKYLLSLKVFDIDKKYGVLEQTPAIIALGNGHPDVFDLLVSEGADMTVVDNTGMDCLMLACSKGYLPVVRYLLSFEEININRQDEILGTTAIMEATAGGHFDVFEYLVSKGADLQLCDNNGNDCLLLACSGGHLDIVKHLLSLHIFDLSREGGDDHLTPIMMAEKYRHSNIYRLLMSPVIWNKDHVSRVC